MNFLLKTELTSDQDFPVPAESKPRSLAETGVHATVLEDIALKSLYLRGPFSVAELSRQMRLSYEVAEDIFHRLRGKMLCEVTGMRGTFAEIAISSGGRTRALDLLAQCQYAGPAPVSLEGYVEQVRRQAAHKEAVHAEDIERAFAHLVLDAETLAQLGTALNSGAPLFIYGPAGVGKTAAAEALAMVRADDAVWIPYAIEIDGQIITVHDSILHKPASEQPIGDYDERWARCKRPAVVVGGELTAEMLDLEFNPVTRYYDGPPQMKANNGVLVIDDFGRQRIQPEDLLNRWVVPLDRRIEFLSMVGGRKIDIPFELLVVFASNRDPNKVLDPAFLRRIQTKVHIGAATNEQFAEIFHRIAAERGLEVGEGIIGDLIVTIRESLHEELRSCYPRDLINQVCWAASYQNTEPRLDRGSLLRAVQAYFVSKE